LREKTSQYFEGPPKPEIEQDSDKTFSEDEEEASPKTEREMILAEARKPI